MGNKDSRDARQKSPPGPGETTTLPPNVIAKSRQTYSVAKAFGEPETKNVGGVMTPFHLIFLALRLVPPFLPPDILKIIFKILSHLQPPACYPICTRFHRQYHLQTTRPTNARLRGVAIGKDNTILVSDFSEDVVLAISPTTGSIRRFGSSGDRNGQFRGPYGIAVDSDFQIYVVDKNSDRSPFSFLFFSDLN